MFFLSAAIPRTEKPRKLGGAPGACRQLLPFVSRTLPGRDGPRLAAARRLARMISVEGEAVELAEATDGAGATAS